ncbi:unnamed protein product [Parajaminaea phylloscopi]
MDRPRRSNRVVGTDTPADSPRGSAMPLDEAGQFQQQHQQHQHQQLQQSAAPSAAPQKQRPARYKPYHTVLPIDPQAPGAGPLPSHLQPSWPLSRSSQPCAPGQPIGPGQALYTTFPSRMKLGVSTLMQPLPQQGDFSDPVYGRGGHQEMAALPGSTRSGRITKTTRYYEDESEVDDESEGSDDGEGPGGQRTPATGNASPRGRSRRLDASNPASGSRSTPIHGANTGDAAHDPTLQPFEPPGFRLGKPPPGSRVAVKKARRTAHVYYTEGDAARAADHRESLVPIKIELELESGHRIKDSFVWNINERLYTPEHFVRVFLQDLDLPYDPYGQQIEASILQQIDDWTPLAEIDVSPAPGGIWACREADAAKGEKRRADIADVRERNKDARSWDWGIKKEFRRHQRALNAASDVRASKARLGKRKAIDSASSDKVEGCDGQWEDDLRVVVNYDVQILHHSLRDRLEWDLSSPLTPEAFAAQTCKDLGLSGEALPIVSSALRESLLNHKRAVGELGLVGLGEMWGKAQAEEDEARDAIVKEQRATRSRRLATLSGLAGSPEGTPLTPADTSIAATPAPLLEGALDNTVTEDGPLATPQEGVLDSNDSINPPMPPGTRLAHALATKQDLTTRGPRLLVGAWRDWFESKEFGPLLEYLTDVEVERREVEALRTMRRNRRDMARSGEGGGGGGGGGGGINIREARFRAR